MSASECLLRILSVLKYGALVGLVSAVSGGVVADLWNFGYNLRIWVILTCGAIGIIFGIVFGARPPVTSPRSQGVFNSLRLSRLTDLFFDYRDYLQLKIPSVEISPTQATTPQRRSSTAPIELLYS